MQKLDIRELYYITHIDNLPSILARGVFSHERIESEQIYFQKEHLLTNRGIHYETF